MLDTRERLALVTPHGIGELDAPRGGIPDLTSMDVAAAMGLGVDQLGAELLLVKYADDVGQLKPLRTRWFMYVMEWGKKQHQWKAKKPGRFKNLSDVTLAEYLSLHVCPTCQGRGEVPVMKSFKQCTHCGGSGRIHPTSSQMASEIGVSQEDYHRTWESRVQWCRDELESKERVAISLIWANLR